MGFPAVTYTFSNSTTADASQVNQNFTDLVNGLSDTTKDISISAATLAGNLSVSGNTTLGNASGDDVTITGSLASTIPIKTTNTYDIGSSTLGLRAAYFGANSQTVNIKASSSMSATWTFTLPVTAGTSGYFLKTDGSGVSSWSAFTTPTIQKFITGTAQTYTTPAGVKYIKVRIVGGGGGGGGGGTGAGAAAGAGGTSSFGSSMFSCTGGAAGGFINAGAGGSGSLGTGPIGSAFSGSGGNCYCGLVGTNPAGGSGGCSPFGGNGLSSSAGPGTAGAGNSGSGGGGGGGGAACYGGGGGGSGGYAEGIIAAPSATYTYTVGAAGTAGGAGGTGQVGGSGAVGYIEVTEYYQ